MDEDEDLQEGLEFCDEKNVIYGVEYVSGELLEVSLDEGE